MKVGDTVKFTVDIPFYGIKKNTYAVLEREFSWENGKEDRYQLEDGFSYEIYVPYLDDVLVVSDNEIEEVTLLEKALNED